MVFTRTINIVPRDGQKITLGRSGENIPLRFCFILKGWLEGYPAGNAVLWVIPPHKAGGYWANTAYDAETQTLEWIPTESDLAVSGEGKM